MPNVAATLIIGELPSTEPRAVLASEIVGAVLPLEHLERASIELARSGSVAESNVRSSKVEQHGGYLHAIAAALQLRELLL